MQCDVLSSLRSYRVKDDLSPLLMLVVARLRTYDHILDVGYLRLVRWFDDV